MTPAAPSRPTPLPARRPLSLSSTWPSWISLRTSSAVWLAARFTSSATDSSLTVCPAGGGCMSDMAGGYPLPRAVNNRLGPARNPRTGWRSRRSGGEVGPGRPGRVAAPLGLLPVLLAPERRQVEEVVGPTGRLQAPGVLRVGVEHPAVHLQEAAAARHLDRLVAEVVLAAGGVLGPGAVVVHGRRHRLVDRDAEVVVEVGSVRRVPGDVPALLALPALELGQRRPRHHGVARVAGVEVLEEAGRELVGPRRAAGAAVLPRRVEHEVVDDELVPPVEQVAQADGALRALQRVVLVDLDHRQLAPFGVERVTPAGQLLLLRPQRGPAGPPLL